MSTERRSAAKNDPRDQPAYGLAEAARYLKLPPATLRAWTFGRQYPTTKGAGQFRPLIRPASSRPPLLSFTNLIEAHVLRALRTEHGVPVEAVRKAVRYAERTLSIDRLLLSPELRAEAGRMFLDRYGELINLSASGQLAMRQVLNTHLQRVEWKDKFPIRLHPFVLGETVNANMPIAIDPRIAFGRPVVASRSISTAAIVGRIDAGESVDEVAADYEISAEDVSHAVLYERAA
ncbi:MAG: hypothetical protein A3F70_16675 [Acidobacteria bacterium RIFCSPLOWO2_12_FULL_67_14]|nr:MAG: hypothetical protein A3H29_11190 [Acidobacteria bacterium RIFCSPLOWO2_02_FULL_67_21]OFW37341.1 MAG: hypothetical protein A3F70_16675 [Acidobacteria bacterium RIFCSPLOWO2_12_FULL_67_14]